ERRLLLHLAAGGVERLLAGVDPTLGEVPVVVDAQEQVARLAAVAADDDRAGGASRRRGRARHAAKLAPPLALRRALGGRATARQRPLRRRRTPARSRLGDSEVAEVEPRQLLLEPA